MQIHQGLFQMFRPRSTAKNAAMRLAVAFLGAIVVAIVFSDDTRAQCSSPLMGRWGPNAEAQAASDPGFIEIKLTSCGDTGGTSALTQTEDTGIGASFSKIALAEVVHVKGRQSLLWALM
jgi:hypothetical protein